MRISIIGSGNVATCLGKLFVAAGHELREVYSPNPAHAGKLAELLKARVPEQLKTLDTTIDLCLIAVKDDAIQELATKLKFDQTVVAHTAGSISMEVLKESSAHYGVFYPFQTFSKERALAALQTLPGPEIPFCIEAASSHAGETLKELAASLRAPVYHTDSVQRKQLHLAGVFACNFSNHLYAIAEGLLKASNLPFQLLHPLIRETAEKARNMGPEAAQTGPALRGDEQVQQAHLALLNDPRLQELYRLISSDISRLHKIVHPHKSAE